MTFLSRAVSAVLQGRKDEMAIDAHVSAEPIILGAQTLSDASAALTIAPGAPLHLRFDLGLPGSSRLQGEGDLETSAAARFRGDVDFSSADFALLREWASLDAPEVASKIAAFGEALAYRSVSLSGAIEASATGFSGRNLKIALDRTTLTGSLAFTGPVGGEAGRLDVDLASDSLDVDSLPSLGAEAKIISDLDLSLSLKAGSLHIARVGEAEIDSGSMSLKATKTRAERDPRTLERGGAGRRHRRHPGRDGSRLRLRRTGRLRADRLHDFAVLVSRLAPGDWSQILVERAGELSPASLTFDARGGRRRGEAPAMISLEGQRIGRRDSVRDRARSAVEGQRARRDDKPRFSKLRRTAASARFASATTGKRAGARVAQRVRADGNRATTSRRPRSVAGSDLAWRGRFLPAAHADDARLFGAAKVKAPNIVPLVAALGLAPASGGALGPADIGFDATLRGDRWTFSRLAATIAGIKASGSLSFRPTTALEAVAQASAEISHVEEALDAGAAVASPQQPQEAEIEGELTVDRMPLGSLLALALGPPQPSKAGARWSDAKFAPTRCALHPPR